MLTYPPIGISGRARGGKNSFARRLTLRASSVGIPSTTRAFADPLRETLLALDPILDPYGAYHPDAAIRLSDVIGEGSLGHTWESVKATHYGPEVRRLLQRLGTEGIRAQDPDFWVDAARRFVYGHPDTLTIFTDVRFPNEAEFIFENGGTLVHIDRPSLGPVTDEHESENIDALRSIADFTVTNSSTVPYFDPSIVTAVLKSVI